MKTIKRWTWSIVCWAGLFALVFGFAILLQAIGVKTQ